MNSILNEKYKKLQTILNEMQSVVIGFSGGVDSTLLLKVACDLLGEKAVAVIGKSDTYPANEYHDAVETAKMIGVNLIEIDTKEIDNPAYKKNLYDRCYHCKTELFSKLTAVAREKGIKWVIDGSISDDLSDFRPGLKAKDEQEVRSPLMEAGFTKAEVRELSKFLGLPNWNKPSFACLSSRFPYGFEITNRALRKIEDAESFLRERGFLQVRVRNHDDKTVRIELGPDEIPKITENNIRNELVSFLKKIGFTYITLDLQGYRTGSMNEILSEKIKKTIK